jgi:hypothetical protein
MLVNQFPACGNQKPYAPGKVKVASMSSSDRGRGNAPSKPKDQQPSSVPPAADPAEPYPDWMDRMQRTRARHAAITRNLNTWSSYKNWADRMRESWEDEEQKPDGSPHAATGGNNKSR